MTSINDIMNLQDLSKYPIIASGGESNIREYDNEYIIKEFKDSVNISVKERKCKQLIQMNLPKEVVRIVSLIYVKNKFVGILMVKIDGEDFRRLSNKKFVTANGLTTKDILGMLLNIKNVIDDLHSKNIIIGDLNDQNILFDNKMNIYFIDIDSWSIGSDRCEVAMESFQDPNLISNNFTPETDNYSLSIIIWKALTRIHPFGGKMNPDIPMIERMKNGMSVISRTDVTIPKIAKYWSNLSPKLINTLDEFYQHKERHFGDVLENMYNCLKYCDIHNDYYYGKFKSCPICDKDAKIITTPIKIPAISGFKVLKILPEKLVRTTLNQYSYVNKQGIVADIWDEWKQFTLNFSEKYYFLKGTPYGIYTTYNTIHIIRFLDPKNPSIKKEICMLPKKYKSDICVDNGSIYFISQKNVFTKLTPYNYGNDIKYIDGCGDTSYFNVDDDSYLLLSTYSGKLIISIDGHMQTIPYDDIIVNYGIHHDKIKDLWLVILEGRSGKTLTMILNQTKKIYEFDNIKFSCSLDNIDIRKSILYIPGDKKITALNPNTFVYQNLDCDIVTDNTKIICQKNGFKIINEENIYELIK